MGWRDNFVKVDEMRGQTFTSVHADEDSVTFQNDKVRYTLYHETDCCESVVVEEIIGDLEDLTGWPLLIAREDHNAEGEELPNEESYTWTFYNFATFKGYVTIRFLGTSNGFYSEDVSCRRDFFVSFG